MPYIGNPSAQRFTSPRAASVFSGDGSTTAFTLEEAVATDEDILVSVDGVIQEPSVAYAVSNATTLTFTAAPSSNSGNNIFVYYIARTLGSVSMPDGQNVNAANFSASGTGAITGNTTVGGTLGVTGVLTGTSLDISGDIDVDGTTNLDVVDIDGAVDMASTLTVGGLTTLNGKFLIDGSNNDLMTFRTTGDTASQVLGLQFQNNSEAVTAQIFGTGDNSTSGVFRIKGIGSVELHGGDVAVSGDATNMLKIDANGHVTKPNQPAFSAIATGQDDLAASSVLQIGFAGAERFDQNSDFNTSNSTFTAPVTGKYQFNVGIRVKAIDTGAGYVLIRLNTSNANYDHIFDSDEFSSDLDFSFFAFSILADMDAADTCIVQFFQNGGTQQADIDGASYFSGYLVA